MVRDADTVRGLPVNRREPIARRGALRGRGPLADWTGRPSGVFSASGYDAVEQSVRLYVVPLVLHTAREYSALQNEWRFILRRVTCLLRFEK